MSRRFGRNQKRRMREALAASESARLQENEGRIIAEGLARETSRKLAQLREHTADFIGRLGRYAIAAGEPMRFESDFLRSERTFRLPVHQELSVRMLDRLSTASMETTAAICAEVMHLLDVEAVRNPMAQDMHVRVSFNGHAVGYAMSEHAIHDMTAEELTRRIAPEIVLRLVHEIKGLNK